MPVFVVPPTEDMQAYDYFLQARSMLQRSTHAESTANAQRFFARAVERDPQFAEAWAGLCMSWLEWYYYQPEVTKIEQAEASCLRALELDPELAEGRAALGELYRKTGRFELAIIEYETALRLDRKTAPAWRGLGEAFAELDRDGEAEDAMRRAVDLDPDDLVNYSALGGFYFAHGRYAEAAGIYGRMAQHPGAGASAWNGQGAAFYMMGQFDRAAAAYREVVAREPSASAWSNIGSMYYYNGQYQDAVVAYREAIAQTPENPTFWGNLGDALREIDGGAEEAASAYQQAADLAEELIPVTPENVDLLANLAHYHARLGDDDRAGQYISRALFTAPDDVYAHYYAALVHLEAGRVQNALDEAARTVKLGYPRFLLEADPQFSALRSEPLFRDLMARDQEN
jgi:tetratricopeptide (TPR) repeat protein